MKTLNEQAAHNLAAVREQKPLIHNITNFVVMNYTANALLAMGASPVMAHAQNEVEDMVSFAGALVLNIGTLTDDWIASMITAGQKASERQTPIILDPVGSGATPLRTHSAKKIIDAAKISVIRGNASEILSLRHDTSKTKGVDSIHSVEEAADAATVLAEELNTTLAITGAVDLVTDGSRMLRVANGHPLMGYVTGTGCTATVVIGAFLAVDDDPLSATATALAYFGLAGEVAGHNANAPGSFMIQMIDALYSITPRDLQNGAKMEGN
ncbi:MAG: hydroxyethylthiazole kinase [Desulfobacterales bacterium]|jgi:hydroxyethylthiazole kinase